MMQEQAEQNAQKYRERFEQQLDMKQRAADRQVANFCSGKYIAALTVENSFSFYAQSMNFLGCQSLCLTF